MEKIKKYKIVELLIVFIIPLTIGSLLFISPFYSDLNLIDEGQFGAWAFQMLHGKLMFRDIYITYGPLYIYPLYLLFKLFGSTAFLVRLYFYTFNTVIGALCVLLFISKIKLSYMVKIGLLLSLLLIPGISIRQGVVFVTLFFDTGILHVKNASGLFVRMLNYYFIFDLSDSGIVSLLVTLAIIYFKLMFSKNLRSQFLSFVMIIVGALIIIGVFAIWAGTEGWLTSYLYVTNDVLRSFSGMNLPNGKAFPYPLPSLFNSTNLVQLIKNFFSQNMLLYYQLLLYLGSIIYFLERFLLHKKEQYIFFICVISIGVITYYSQIGRNGNFYLTLTPALILLAYFAQNLLDFINSYRQNKNLALIGLFIIGFFLIRVVYIFHTHFILTPKLIIPNSRNSVNFLGPINISNAQDLYIIGLQQYVWKNSLPTDKIFFLSNEPMMYLLTQRQNATKYDLPYIAHTIDKRYEVLSELKDKKPKLIFYDTYSWPVDEVSNTVRLPEVVNFIKQNYTKSTILNGRVEVYTIKHS